MSLSRERAEYGDAKVFEFVERNKNLRAIQRYTDALEQGQVTIVKRKASNTLKIENEVRQLRSRSIQYNKGIWIICQNPSGTTHRVETLETGKLMFSVANKVSSKDFFLRLNSIPNPEDGVANDVRYHLPFWVKAIKSTTNIKGCYDR